MPAFADDFPSDGYMLEDMVYEEAATHSNMGVYDGAVTATAEYEDILYQIGAGTYLPAGATVAKQCPANSYCPGATDVTYNESESQGAKSCPSGYPNSAAGAWSNTQCYTACTVSMVEHASAVSGKDYYGDGPDTCFATACEGGYHVEGSAGVIEQTPLIDVDYTVAGNGYGYIMGDGSKTYKTDTYGLTENGTWATEFDYGVVYGRASCQATLHDPGYDYIRANYNSLSYGKMSPDQVRSDLTPIFGAAKANYLADVVAGIADGTKGEEAFLEADAVVFGLAKDASFSTSDTGQYCYCQMTGFQSASSGESGYDISKAVAVASAPWKYYNNAGSAATCASDCAGDCAGKLRSSITNGRSFRGAMLGALDFVADGTCEVNKIAAGQYLPAWAEVPAQCPANSYCPGATGVIYNESAAQGISSCPSDYPNSAAGASAITQCYTACKDSMVEHASAVDGNDYYGTGTDTCAATACEGGYHVEGSVGVIEQTPLIDVDYTVAGYEGAYISADGGDTRYADEAGLTENNTWASPFDYGVVYGRASCQSTLHDPGLEYIFANIQTIMDGTMSADQVRSELTPIVGAAKANYFADVIAGMWDGTKGEEALFEAVYVVFGISKDALFSTTDTGQYCYCQMTGFQSGSSGVAPVSLDEGSDTTGIVSIASAPWVFGNPFSSESECANYCASYCADVLPGDDAVARVFRGAVFGSLGTAGSGPCEANEITIKWSDATEEDIAANNAGMCTYGGDIRTPIKAATKPGKTFIGWKFYELAE